MKKILIVAIGGWFLIEIAFFIISVALINFASPQTIKEVGYLFGQKIFNPIITEFISEAKAKPFIINHNYQISKEHLFKNFKLGEKRESIKNKLSGVSYNETACESNKCKFIYASISYSRTSFAHADLIFRFYFDDDDNLIDVKGHDIWNRSKQL